MASAQDFVGVDLLMETQSPLHWAPGTVVLHPVAHVRGNLSIIPFQGDLDLEFTLRREEQGLHVLRQAHQCGGPIEVTDRRLVLAHRIPPCPASVCRSFGTPVSGVVSAASSRLNSVRRIA